MEAAEAELAQPQVAAPGETAFLLEHQQRRHVHEDEEEVCQDEDAAAEAKLEDAGDWAHAVDKEGEGRGAVRHNERARRL